MPDTPPSPTPDVWAFLHEIFVRLGAKSPKFFKVWSWIGAIATAITGIPTWIASIPGLKLPESVVDIQNSTVAVAGMVVFFMAKLAVQRPVINSEGIVPGSGATLPFTEKKEAAKTEPLPDVVTPGIVNPVNNKN